MNPIQIRLNATKNKELTIGSWLTIPSFQIVEIMSSAGFEWLTIDLEHSHIGIENTVNLIAHIQANSMSALAGVSKNEEVIIKKRVLMQVRMVL